MGKKKKGGGGRKSKGRASGKEKSSQEDECLVLISEELTALSAIYPEDLQVISHLPHMQYRIILRSHMSDTGDRNSSASAVLSVRCLPGYPKKCPKLQISEAKGLKKENADQLLSLLNAQANFNAREGQVMIYNLVEAAREFLSDIPLPEESHISRLSSGGENFSAEDGEVVGSRHDARNRTFVHGSYDLYSDMSGVSWDQIFEKHVANDSQSKSPREKGLLLYKIEPKIMTRGASMVERVHRKVFKAHLAGFNDVGQREESLPYDISESELVRGGSKSVSNEVPPEKDVRSMSEPLETSAAETIDDDKSEGEKKDLILVYLLRILSVSKMSFSSTEIASELFNMGMLSQWGKDLVSEPSLFDKAFAKAFRNYMASSPLSQFWKISLDVSNVSAPSLKSRYLNDFEEISSLGHGGFGHVVLCKNKLDGRQYAVKKIRLKDESLSVNDKIMREVATLSRLQHQHIVRYYQAWFETGIGGSSTWGSTTQDDLSFSYFGASSASSIGQGNTQEMTFLYIQMEYCPRTLRQDLSSFTTLYDKQATWHLCRQIVEGLAHIHSQGIIHRDLTPNNIFFDSRNDVKIGDFGLAKFLKLEKVDQEHSLPSEASVVSMDGTSQAGTPFYTAPEIEHGWPQINEKVDMYSLGVVFLELWHPFSTSMERYFVLSELKNKGTVPTSWARDFPEQASLVRRLTSPSPSDRPSAVQILRHELPPRMEDEWLDDVLRTIQTSEDTYVYEQILSTIFDEERITTKIKRRQNERKTTESHSSFRQCTFLSTQLQDSIVELCKEVFCLHGGKRLEIAPIRLFDGENQHDRKKSVKLLTSTGNMLELTHEFRSPFVSWVITNQVTIHQKFFFNI